MFKINQYHLNLVRNAKINPKIWKFTKTVRVPSTQIKGWLRVMSTDFRPKMTLKASTE